MRDDGAFPQVRGDFGGSAKIRLGRESPAQRGFSMSQSVAASRRAVAEPRCGGEHRRVLEMERGLTRGWFGCLRAVMRLQNWGLERSYAGRSEDARERAVG